MLIRGVDPLSHVLVDWSRAGRMVLFLVKIRVYCQRDSLTNARMQCNLVNVGARAMSDWSAIAYLTERLEVILQYLNAFDADWTWGNRTKDAVQSD